MLHQVLRYVAEVSGGQCSVGLQPVPADSPLGRLRGSDNILQINTSMYSTNPLVIQGAGHMKQREQQYVSCLAVGAGAEVTAAGVVADLIGLAQVN